MCNNKAKQSFEGLECYEKGYEDGIMDGTKYCLEEIAKCVKNILQLNNEENNDD